jgi:hypothetical protein
MIEHFRHTNGLKHKRRRLQIDYEKMPIMELKNIFLKMMDYISGSQTFLVHGPLKLF